ncbi:polyketide cyclase [Candidatus Mycobacterium wuenschmannii]|uniref:Polyketide cyclase n=1 Tax=Candidatus Mycobacterium wuenschmannii TaxID=3027808 RepID=A0ABY8VWV5_9MYCO|nr:polyketide cyclase [Candidatus Mycobacterium wuenschmannii]WIM87977.1 polyketide cyclase [Candidatus Mycobacterium wuenschmannii]
MTNDTTLATITIPASAEAVFGILANPATHESIDGTGWVRESLDGESLTRNGQVFRIAMYHDNHPDKNYEMANKVTVFDRPHAIAWEPGQDLAGDGNLSFGGWIWRYDIADAGPSEVRVTLTYDWSAVPAELREHIGFPPFEPSHLENSLRHLSDLAARA